MVLSFAPSWTFFVIESRSIFGTFLLGDPFGELFFWASIVLLGDSLLGGD